MPGNLERIRASGDAIYGQIRNTQLRKPVGNQRIGFGGRIVAGADVQRQRQRVISHIRRIVAGGACTGEWWDRHRRTQSFGQCGIIIQAADVGNRERARVEEFFSGCDHSPRGVR